MQFPPRKKVASCNFVAADFVLLSSWLCPRHRHRFVLVGVVLFLPTSLAKLIGNISSASASGRLGGLVAPRWFLVAPGGTVGQRNSQWVCGGWRSASCALAILRGLQSQSQGQKQKGKGTRSSSILPAIIFICWPSLCGTRPGVFSRIRWCPGASGGSGGSGGSGVGNGGGLGRAFVIVHYF